MDKERSSLLLRLVFLATLNGEANNIAEEAALRQTTARYVDERLAISGIKPSVEDLAGVRCCTERCLLIMVAQWFTRSNGIHQISHVYDSNLVAKLLRMLRISLTYSHRSFKPQQSNKFDLYTFQSHCTDAVLLAISMTVSGTHQADTRSTSANEAAGENSPLTKSQHNDRSDCTMDAGVDSLILLPTLLTYAQRNAVPYPHHINAKQAKMAFPRPSPSTNPGKDPHEMSQSIETSKDQSQKVIDCFSQIIKLISRSTTSDRELTMQKFQSQKDRFEEWTRTYISLLYPNGLLGTDSHRADVIIMWSELIATLNEVEAYFEKRIEVQEEEGREEIIGKVDGDDHVASDVESIHDAVQRSLDMLVSRTKSLRESGQ